MGALARTLDRHDGEGATGSARPEGAGRAIFRTLPGGREGERPDPRAWGADFLRLLADVVPGGAAGIARSAGLSETLIRRFMRPDDAEKAGRLPLWALALLPVAALERASAVLRLLAARRRWLLAAPAAHVRDLPWEARDAVVSAARLLEAIGQAESATTAPAEWRASPAIQAAALALVEAAVRVEAAMLPASEIRACPRCGEQAFCEGGQVLMHDGCGFQGGPDGVQGGA